MPTTLRIGGAEGGFQTRPYELGTPRLFPLRGKIEKGAHHTKRREVR